MDRRRLESLAAALNTTGLAGAKPIAIGDFKPLPAAGVGHDHLVIQGRGRLVRLPRLSQTGRAAEDNLRYQAACFARAQPSGATPALHGVLGPSGDWPMGALIVAMIDGRPPKLPDDLTAIAHCLAAIHRLPVPAETAPLPMPGNPVTETLLAIAEQSSWLDEAGLSLDAVRMIRAEIVAARAAEHPSRAAPPSVRTLVVSDAHPGNYVIDHAGKAWFVDLEKAVFGQPAIDIAHVTLPTSVGWDRRIAGTLADRDVVAFEDTYLDALPEQLAGAIAPWLGPIRRLVWLRTVSWLVRWLARSGRPDDPWSAADLPAALRAHMAAHARHSLSASELESMGAALPDW